MPQVAIGTRVDKLMFSAQSAIVAAMHSREAGYIWILHRNCWRIAGNYDGRGGVWNGKVQVVPATAADLLFIARTSP